VSKLLTIDYYTDILCVWAWIAQQRIDELNHNFNNQILIKHHYLDIFGNTEEKMQRQWSQKESFEGFAKHVIESSAPYEKASVNADVWTKTRPSTSANAHLVLKAISLCYDDQTSVKMALVFRQAFFVNAIDISNISQLYDIIQQHNLDMHQIKQKLIDGKAMAALMVDYQSAKQLNLKGSPTYIIDNGRQTLYGNVGYRVLHANIEEQLKNPANEASWC
jgi:predicted DsbA family dithiol-disulfide isomerase